MKNIEISPSLFIRDAEYREFLGRIAAYVFLLFCLVPLVTGVLLPYSFSLTDEPFASLLMRLMMLIATGTASALLAWLPAFFVLRSSVLRRIYVFLLFPVSIVSLAIQAIMYREFGTEIDTRFFGLFRGNFSALWTFARREYHLDWAIALLIIASVALAYRICRSGCKPWAPSVRLSMGLGLILLMNGSLSLALHPDIPRVDHYSPVKLSTAPLFQVVMFLGGHYFVGHTSGYRGILEDAGEITTDEYGELTKRLGVEPGMFSQREVHRPAWLKKKPSHVFLFVMESIGYDVVENPDLADLAPYIRRFANEGLLTPNFSASSGCTIDAIQATVSGVATQARYPVPRTLERFKLDTLARVLKRADYKPIFFAASQRKFGAKGDSCEAYGYDYFTGCADVAHHIKSNEWGVNDGDFFEWARGQLADLQTPHFISFLNVSNHTPHDAPVDELGDVTFTDAALDCFFGRNRKDKIHFAKHIKYADWKLGEMAEKLKRRYPDALFVFVGDHASSKLCCDPLLQVPFVLWNDRVIDTSVDTSRWYGAHMDILATLANLVLPDGDRFTTLGNPVWSQANDRVSSAGSLVLTNKGYLTKKGERRMMFPTAHQDGSSGPHLSDSETLLKCSAINALSWGYRNAEELPHKESPTPDTREVGPQDVDC
ncbi:MAG: sulfatase-like hydrolase/transferase [Akkermansiaceae bacterium]|nr:sulfatase-like hydrolase/transferase [Akkermansiaceae bacterium]